MIPIVEDLLSNVIEERLKWLRNNTDIVDRIFSNATVTARSRLKEYLKNSNGIKVLRGFPMDRTQLPSYVIMLGAERETQQHIGDYIGDDEFFSLESITGEVQPIIQRGEIYAVKTKNAPLYEVESIEYDGMIYEYEFDFIDPDKGVLMLMFPVDTETSGEVKVNYTYKRQGAEEYGSYFHTQYRVETWTNNGDLTVILYHLLKWIMLSSRDKFHEEGLNIQTIGGLDFEPAPEYFPEFVYRRALTFECVVENSYQKEYDFIKDIDVSGEISDPDVEVD